MQFLARSFLAPACLGFYRESQDIKHFDLWASRLEQIDSDTSIRFCAYASLISSVCWHSGAWITSALHSNLSEWAGDEDDPFWLIRQAAIFVELGNLDEAGRLAYKGLTSIRAGLISRLVNDVGTLSREGWAMKAVLVIRHAKSIRAFSHRIKTLKELERDFRGRWRSLAGFRPAIRIRSSALWKKG